MDDSNNRASSQAVAQKSVHRRRQRISVTLCPEVYSQIPTEGNQSEWIETMVLRGMGKHRRHPDRAELVRRVTELTGAVAMLADWTDTELITGVREEADRLPALTMAAAILARLAAIDELIREICNQL